MGFTGGTSKGPACQGRRCKRCGFDPWVRKIPWRKNGNPFQYSCLENPMDRGAWQTDPLGGKEPDMTEVTEHSTRSVSVTPVPRFLTHVGLTVIRDGHRATTPAPEE